MPRQPGLAPRPGNGKVVAFLLFAHRAGKGRVERRLAIVATDRISAFDWVLPTAIPDKGRVLTGLSAFWFARIKVANHLLSLEPSDIAGAILNLTSAAAAFVTGQTLFVDGGMTLYPGFGTNG